MAPRRRRGPGPVNEPSATERSIAKSQLPPPSQRASSSSRVQDRRRDPQPNVMDRALGTDIDWEAAARWQNRQPTAAGRKMVAGAESIGRPDPARNYSTSMAANMDAYFKRLMAQPSPSDVDPTQAGPSRYGEIPYGDIGETQQQFRELQRQAMMRRMARQIMEGGQPTSMSQMMGQSYDQAFERSSDTDISEYPVDPIYGQQDRRQYPNGELYYEAENIDTLGDALAERRETNPVALPPDMAVQMWNRGNQNGARTRPFSPNVVARYQRR